jgi:hypothetical protein
MNKAGYWPTGVSVVTGCRLEEISGLWNASGSVTYSRRLRNNFGKENILFLPGKSCFSKSQNSFLCWWVLELTAQ